ncbi:hypothetical protein [Bacillus atrophaeus]|uniref:hypothetical protein n=1 Tax=Bacillus atrophaeus TaxID=1452 RepID=UPI00227E013E|nr:hypothetical protein [Bacillus atrophaeus]MCY9205972.1 hypothetical protein [Bacillus atrophaeus]MEC0886928.1 hypothetical protein [Bacillus atrophaeus]
MFQSTSMRAVARDSKRVVMKNFLLRPPQVSSKQKFFLLFKYVPYQFIRCLACSATGHPFSERAFLAA